MRVKERKAHVHFYAVVPMPSFDGRSTFAPGAFPLEFVLDSIRRRDPAAEDYRIHDHLWGGETLCLLHEDGPEPILGAYYRDNLSKLLTEYKGEITEAMLREGEAPVDAAYLAFFPDDVVGMLRTSAKSPGFAKVGTWLSSISDVSCGLEALADADTMAQLQAHATGLRRLTLRARRGRIPLIAQHAPDVAEVLRIVADTNRSTEEVLIELRAGRRNIPAFSRRTLSEVAELMAIMPELEEAKVLVKGQTRPIDLKRSHVVGLVSVSLVDTKRIGLHEAADALFQAYEREQPAIQAAMDVRRGPRREDTSALG